MNRNFVFFLVFIILQNTAVYAQSNTIAVYTTAENTAYRLTMTSDSSRFYNNSQPPESQVCVIVDPTHHFQTLLGIGGAITDASAETYAKLPAAVQKRFLDSYYDTVNGIGYTLGRTNINSCDFSSESYTYVTDENRELKSFSIEHDKKFKIPFIRQIITATRGKLTL